MTARTNECTHSLSLLKVREGGFGASVYECTACGERFRLMATTLMGRARG